MLSGIKAKVIQPAFYFPDLCLNKRGMKKVLSLVAFLWICHFQAVPQNRAVRVLGYHPAPGQFINNDLLGTPEAAQRITTGDGHLVSLGSFGGSLILGFEKPVVNDPRNPYGIDFTLYGNAFDGSSEPGVVWVMKDSNGNGLPDDTWYELAGSSSFHPEVIRGYRITWAPLGDGSVRWSDGLSSGLLRQNSFHSQPYYPQPEIFPDYPIDSVTLEGTLIPLMPSESHGLIRIPSAGFGYADNRAWNRTGDLTDPDNPYTPDIMEGAGGDPFDISWAIDPEGKYVDLDQIDFIRVVTGVLAVTSLLGEISPEIGGVVATAPTGKSGPDQVTVIHPHREALLQGDSLFLYAAHFVRGRISPEEVSFTVAEGSGEGWVTPGGLFRALRGGEITVEARPAVTASCVARTLVTVREPRDLHLRDFNPQLTAGEKCLFYPELLDQFGDEITGTAWRVTVEDPGVAAVNPAGEGFELKTLAPGETSLLLTSARFAGFSRSFTLSVTKAPAAVRVFASAQSSDENLFPAQWITIPAHSVNDHVENRKGDYSQPSFVTLAQAASAILTRAGTPFLFREEPDNAQGLYLYSVEKEGLFTYGWGGKIDPLPFARAWIFRKNNTHYLDNWQLLNVSDGDTLILYHVDNIQEEWKLSILTSMPSEAQMGDELEVTVTEVRCVPGAQGEIAEVERRALSNQAVAFRELGKSVAFTDLQGKTRVVVPTMPPLVLWSGLNAVLITPAAVTPAEITSSEVLRVWPNPFTSAFRVHSRTGEPCRVRVCDLWGRTLREQICEGPETLVPAGDLPAGTYVVEVLGTQSFLRTKLVKK